MANRRFIDFPIASSVGDSDIVLIWQDGMNKQTTKGTLIQGAPTSLQGLTDVDIAGLINGQILQYNSTSGKWENVDRTDIDLSELGDVTIVAPSNGQVLVYNSSTSKWENSSGGYVPYTGAVTTVDLGAQSILAGAFVKAAGTSAQFLKADGSVDSSTYLTTGSAATLYVPYTGATADVNLGTHDLLAERGTFENNGSSDTLTVNHTSGSGYGIKVTKGGNNEALYVNKTSGSGNAMAVTGGRTSLVDLALSTVTNTAGDILTLSGGVVHKRTASEIRSDIGAGTGNGTVTSVGLSSATSGVTIGSTPVTTSGTITLAIATASGSQNGLLSSTDWTTFNNKQNALTNPVTGTGTSGTIPIFTGSTTIGDSIIKANSTEVNIVGNGSALLFDSLGLTKNGGIGYIDDFVLNVYNSRGTGSAIQLGNTNLNLITDSTTRLRILDTGEVGIGTDTPATTLEVNGVGLFSGGSLVGNTKNGVYIYDTVIASLAGGNSRSLQIQAQTLSIYTGTTYTEKLKVFENGNVVISTSPTDNGARLQVSGASTFSDKLFISNSSGVSLIGLTNQLSVSSGSYNLFDISRFSNNEFGPNFYLVKSRNGTIGSNTIVASGDNLGNIIWVGANGTGFTVAASIRAEVDGTPGASNDMPGRLVFSTTADGAGSPTERLRITSSGNVLIGTTTDDGNKLKVNGTIRAEGGSGINVFSGGGTGTFSVDYPGVGGGRLSLNDSGDLTIRGSLTQNASDKRLKKNIKLIENAVEKITKLNGIEFTWDKEIFNTTRTNDIGLIAQEVKEILPDAVTLAPFDTNHLNGESLSGNHYLTVYYEKLIPLLIEGIKELKQEIDTLKAN